MVKSSSKMSEPFRFSDGPEPTTLLNSERTRSRTVSKFPWTRLIFGLASCLLLLAAAIDARGADIPALERQLINPCKNCGGMPLAGSYCGGANQAKQELRDLAAQGKTDEEILAAFVAKHGQWILVTPPRKGFTLLAWILPMVGIVLGGGGLALFLKRARISPGRAHGVQPAPDIAAQAPIPLNDATRAEYREALRRELGDA
jgi:cytochrome c-type biogenesis protein CcmH